MEQRPDNANHYQYEQAMRQQQDLRQQQEALRLKQEERRLQLARRRNRFAWVRNTITLLVGALEILLGLRFFLRLSLANPENLFAQVIFRLSEPFVVPFSTLFISPTNADATRILDVNILMAMVIYALLGGLAFALVNYLQGQDPYR